jgi:hypothetical protein
MGLAVWGMDEAGPYQAIPQPGAHWQPVGRPARYPHEHVRHGTAVSDAINALRAEGERGCAGGAHRAHFAGHLRPSEVSGSIHLRPSVGTHVLRGNFAEAE